jgi:hypothetical protein
MTIKSLSLALIVSLLMPHIHAVQPVSSTENDITITAQAMTANEVLNTFGKNLHDQHIYPIRVQIQNNKKTLHSTNNAITFSSNLVTIANTTVLTPKTLAEEIKAMSYVSAFTGFLLFPITLVSIYAQNKLIDLMPIIHTHSSGDTPIVITPNSSVEIYIFAHARTKKNDDPNATDRYVSPTILDTAITLQSDGWIMKNNTVVKLQVPLK